MGDFKPTGVSRELVQLVRERLDDGRPRARADRGLRRLRRREDPRASRRDGVPVDAYGVGSSLLQGANDFTADVVRLDGEDCAKAGRRFRANPRLVRVV